MANPFDQFDEAGSGNPFDQFDEQSSNPVMNDGLDARTLNQMPSLAGQETNPEAVRSNITQHQRQEQFSEVLRNPLGEAADYLFPSLENARENKSFRPELDAQGQPTGGQVYDKEVFNPGGPGRYTPDIAGGVYNAARSVGELGANVSDLSGLTDSATQKYNETMPRYKSDTKVGEMVQQGAGLIVPGAMGARVGSAVVKGSSALATGGKIVGGILGGSVGTTIAGDTSQGGFLYGKDSLTGYGDDGKGDAYATDANAAFERRKDMLVDALVTDSIGGAVTGAAMAAKNIAGKLIWSRFTRLVSQNTRDRELVEEAIRPLLDVADDASPEEVKQATRTLLDRARNEKTVGDAVRGRLTVDEWDALPDADKELLATNQDAMSVFETLFSKDKKAAELSRDELEAAGDIFGAKKAQDQMLRADEKISAARSMRSGVEASEGAFETRAASEKPISITKSILDSEVRKGGGSEGIEKSGRALQERATAEAKSLDPELDLLKTQKAATEDLLTNRVKSDPIFGKSLKDLGDDVNININATKTATEDEIRDKVSQAIVTKTKELNDVMTKAAKSGATLDQKKLIQAFQTTTADGKKTGVRLSEISDDLRPAFGKNATFENLYPRIPEITAEINRLGRQPGADAKNAKDALIRVKKLLQDPDGTPEQKKIVADSLTYYKDKWAKYFDQGPLGDFYDSYRKNKKSLGAYPEKSIPEGFATDFQHDTRSAIQRSVGDQDYAPQMKGILEETGDQGLIGQHYGAQALSDVQSKINTGTFQPEDMLEVANKMTKDNPIVAGSPELKKQLDDLVSSVRDRKLDIKKLDEGIADLQKEITVKQRDVYLNKFNEFYTRKGITKEGTKGVSVSPASNIQSSYSDLFSLGKGQNKERIAALRKELEATGDPELLKGFEAAYMKEVDSKFFSGLKSESGIENINKTKGNQAKDAILDYADDVFADKNKAAFVKGLIQTAQEAASRKTTARTEVGGLSAIAPDAMNAVRFITQHIFGPLSKPGGKINTTARNLIQMTDQVGRIRRADAVFADIDTMYELGMKYANTKTPLPVHVQHYLNNLSLVSAAKQAPQKVIDGVDWLGGQIQSRWEGQPTGVNDSDEEAKPTEITVRPSDKEDDDEEDEPNYYE